MATYAPDAIRLFQDAITVPTAVNLGIVGDESHSYGYHLGASSLPSSDYSLQTPLDRQGAAVTPNAAAAADTGYSPEYMKQVTAKLIGGLQRNAPELRSVREVFGTVDGARVAGWDQHTGQASSSDASHLWHVHISFYRAYATDVAELQKVAAFINGGHSGSGGGTQIDGDEMTPQEREDLAECRRMLGVLVGAIVPGTNPAQFTGGGEQSIRAQLADVIENAAENREMSAELVTGNVPPARAAVGEKSIADQVRPLLTPEA